MRTLGGIFWMTSLAVWLASAIGKCGDESSVKAAANSQVEILRGSVVDMTGRPVADADVTWFDQRVLSDLLGDAQPKTVKTNAAGEFAVETIPSSRRSHVLVASAPGLATTGLVHLQNWENLRITMHPGHRVRIRLLSPDGLPVVNQKVRLFSIPSKTNGTFFVRARACELFSSETDADGWATFDGLRRGGRAILMTGTGCEWGEQTASFTTDHETTDARLRPVGRVRLTVKDNEGLPIKNLQMAVSSNDNSLESIAESGSVVVTDLQGVVEVPALAVGRLFCRLRREDSLRLRVPTALLGTVTANETANLEVTLGRAIPVRGKVVDAETGQPVSGVVIGEYSGFGATSDERGELLFHEVPGKPLRLNSVRPPEPYLVGGASAVFVDVAEPIVIPDGVTEHQLPTFKLQRGISLQGLVVDEGGQRVPKAKVRCAYPGKGVNYAAALTKEVMADEMGAFRVIGLPPDANVLLTAIGPKAATVGHLESRADAAAPIELRLLPNGWVPVSGKVISAKTERPVPGIDVELHQRVGQRIPGIPSIQNLDYVSQSATTNAQGEFQFEPLARWGQATLFLSAPGFAHHRLSFELADGQNAHLREIRLTPMNSASGIVVDLRGQPVEGVQLFSDSAEVGRPWQETRTNSIGQFSLPLLHQDAFVVFAQKEGYRFTGQRLVGGQAMRIVLARRDEPLPAEQRLKRPGIAKEERQVLIDRVLQAAARSSPDIGPKVVSQLIASGTPLPRQWIRQRLEVANTPHERALLAALSGDPDGAAALIGQIEEPQGQAEAYAQLANLMKDRNAQLELLANSLQSARQVKDPASRVFATSTVIELLLDLDEGDRAKKLVDEILPVAKQLAVSATPGMARGRFADELAVFDLTEALNLVADLPMTTYPRYLGSIAQELAARRPADAERALLMIGDSVWQRDYTPRVCFRMAAVDLERALRLAEEIGAKKHGDPSGFVAIAAALATRSPEKAREPLLRANDVLRGLAKPVAKGALAPDFRAVGAHAALLASQIDPDAAPELLWQGLATRPPFSQSDHLTGPSGFRERNYAIGKLMAAWSLFDQDTEHSRAFADAALKQLFGDQLSVDSLDPRIVRADVTLLASLVMFAPKATVTYCEQLAENGDSRLTQTLPSVWRMLLEALSQDDQDAWTFRQRWVFHQWVADEEEF